MSELVYLVGQISPKYKETYEWRERVIKSFEGESQIQFINPCDSPFNIEMLTTQKHAVSGEDRVFGIDVLPPKDYTFCKRSSIALVNMNQYDPDKPLIGSFFELSWYYTMPEKTVIGFADDLNSYLCQHPFVQKAVTVWVNDEKEACYLLRRYFMGS